MSAQLEDGYTRTANELLERLMKIKLNGTQHNIIYCIIRNTYGFQRKSHAMSLTFISVAIESHKDLVKRELDKLIECNIVKVFKDGDYTHSREIGINKNISDWVVHSKPIGRQSTNQYTVGESVVEQSTNQSTPTVDESVYQERKSFKDIKDSQEEKVMTAMDAYYHSFKKWNYTGQIQGYISELMKRGYTDSFVREIFLAMGEYGANPDVNYMRKTAEDWIDKGIYTLVEAKSRREGEKKKVAAVNQPSNQAPKEYVPDPEQLKELRELERLRKAN